jgi:hypothetical protein
MQRRDSTNSSDLHIRKCEPETHPTDTCNSHHSPTHYQINIADESKFMMISDLLNNSINTKSSECIEFLTFFFCFYLYRSCELHNASDPMSGFQLTICKDKCADVDEFYQECTSKAEIQILRTSAQNQEVKDFASWVGKFMCSAPNTYAIPEVPVSKTSCHNVSFVYHRLPGSASLVRLSMTTTLLLLVTAIGALV